MLGITRVRRDFRWQEIEPARGAFAFEPYDDIVQEAEAYGIRLLETLDYGNEWASENGGSSAPPDNPDDYSNYAAAAARRYGRRVDAWEIWNEPNHPLFWTGDAEEAPGRYPRLLTTASAAMRAADPEVRIILGGTTFTAVAPVLPVGGVEFVTKAFEAEPQLAEFYDAAAIHTYMDYPPKNGPELGTDRDLPLPIGPDVIYATFRP